MTCPICGRVYCDHSPAERGQTLNEMLADCSAPSVVENAEATRPKPQSKNARSTAAASKKKEGLIQHKKYFGGKVQTLGFHSGDAITFETCVVEPGEYDFGTAEQAEMITCTFNEMTVNGKAIRPGSRPFVIRPGDPRKISAKQMATYSCMCR